MRSKIDWLKDYRAQTGCGLHQAMAAYDTMALALRDTEALRDAAALAALQGYCANPHLADDMGYEYNVAARAWAAADAFIAARETSDQGRAAVLQRPEGDDRAAGRNKEA